MRELRTIRDNGKFTLARAISPRFNRRRLIVASALAGASCLDAACRDAIGFSPIAWAAEEEALNRFPRMMQEHLVTQVSLAHERSVTAKSALQTKADAEAYVLDVRARIRKSFGPEPQRTPLNSRTTGVVDRTQYTIEKVIFESRPNFPVTANLYLPKRRGKVPGVVGTCGHSANGKAAVAYQSFAQGLARQGSACLIFDPIGQGERRQYATADSPKHISVGVGEHIQAGNQQFLVGENLSMWRAWDGIRALDYLLTRPEIDAAHVGVTGNSGGGTMTTWLCGVESRWTMAAPACFVTTFLHNARNELPADTEQCPPHVLALGLEHEDFLVALAPKPIVILAKERDYFDIRGSEEAFSRLRKIYDLLGHPQNISLHIGPTEHGYSIENREAMYSWFNHITRVSDQQREPELQIETDETLWCTSSGQVDELRPATVFTFTRDLAVQLKETRPKLSRSELENRIRSVFHLAEVLPLDVPDYRILRDIGNRGYPRPATTTYAVETEPGIFALNYLLSKTNHVSRPPQASAESSTALLYVCHRSSDVELRSEHWLKQRIEAAADQAVFACDPRGVGESLPNTCGLDSFDSAYGCDYFYAVHGLMLDQPYLGRKVYDVLRTIQWIRSFGYRDIELIGNEWGATIATLVAMLSANITSLELHSPLESFHSIAIDEWYDTPLANLPLAVLKHFDLPDCYAQLKPILKA